jgi:uncharacterized protein Yka (UPF0111/DUF47 family)
MKSLFLYLALGAAFLLPACSLFVTDATPGMSALQAQLTIFDDMADSMIELVQNSNADPAIKEQIIAKVNQERQSFHQLGALLREWMESVGDVNYQQLLEELYSLYQEYRSSN